MVSRRGRELKRKIEKELSEGLRDGKVIRMGGGRGDFERKARVVAKRRREEMSKEIMAALRKKEVGAPETKAEEKAAIEEAQKGEKIEEEVAAEKGKEVKEEERAAEETEKAEKEKEEAGEEEEKYWREKREREKAAARKKLLKSWKDAIFGKAKGAALTEVPNVVLVMLLIVVSVVDYYAKAAVGFEPITTGVFSGITFLFFVWVLRSKRWMEVLFFFLALDVFAIPTAMRFMPANPVIPWVLVFKTFVWLATAIIGFFATIFAYERIQKHVPKIAWGGALFLIVLLIVVGMPWCAKAYGDEFEAHREKYADILEEAQIAKEKVSAGLKTQVNVSKDFWGRWWKALPYLFAGNLDKYNEIMNPVELNIKGEIDKDITEYTKVVFEPVKGHPKEFEQGTLQEILVDFYAESPEKEIKISLSCSFTRAGITPIGGVVDPVEMSVLGYGAPVTVSCEPLEELTPGSYKAVFEAKVYGLETKASLTRLFVGDMALQDRERERVAHGLAVSEEPKVPNEFAAFSIGFGSPHTTPVIDDKEEQYIMGGIENLADGRILEIGNIKIDSVVFEEGVVPVVSEGERKCGTFEMSQDSLIFMDREILRKINFEKLKKGDKTPLLLSCKMEMPEELRGEEASIAPKKRTFISTLEYSYKITKEIPFKIKKPIEIELIS